MSVFTREGYFFTLTFASALAAASGVPLAAPEYFRLPIVVSLCSLGIGLTCAVGLMLQWRRIRAFTLGILVLAMISSIAIAVSAERTAIAWLVLCVVLGILSSILLLSRSIGSYLRSR